MFGIHEDGDGDLSYRSIDGRAWIWILAFVGKGRDGFVQIKLIKRIKILIFMTIESNQVVES